MRKRFVLTLAAVGLLASATLLSGAVAEAQGPVALLNPGFEQPDPARTDMPLGWGTYPGSPQGPRMKFIWDDQHAHSGERSVSMVVAERNISWLPSDTTAYATSLKAEDLKEGGVPRPAAIVGHEYLLSAWVRAEGSAQQGAGLVLRWTDENGWIPSYRREYFQLKDESWQLIAISSTAPEGSKWIVPILQVSGSPEEGRIWFDDVTLVDRTGLTCEVRTPPELCSLPSGWRTEVAVTSSHADPLPLILRVEPDVPGGQSREVKGSVSTQNELRADAEYESAEPHRLRYLVTSADEQRAPYFLREVEARSPLEASYLSPRYRSTLYGNTEDRTVRIQARVNATEDVRAQLNLDAEVRVGGKTVAQVTLAKPATAPVAELTLPALPGGGHQVELRLHSGEQVIAQVTLPLHCLPDVEPAVAIGDRNELLVEGKPVFPLGFYSTLPEDFARFKRDGFNTVLTYTSDVKTCRAMTEQAGAAGLKLIVSAPRPFLAERNAEGLRRALSELRDLPGLLGYYLWDEPSTSRPGQAPEDMRWLYEETMAADPSHLTCTVFCRPSEFKLYADTTDVYLVDPYVTHHKQKTDMGRVAQWVEEARRAVKDRKPVWLVPQAFDHLLGPGTYRMPTIAEQRCMCYLGVVHGAKGIIWFVYTGFCIHSEELARQRGLPAGQCAWVYRGTIPHCFPLRWEGIKEIVREVNELSPVLLSEDPEQSQEVVKGGDAVHCLLKASGEDGYLFAVNAKEEPVDFGCVLPARDASVEVLWEERKVVLKQSLLEDHFEPYGVHVYRFAMKH